MERRATEASGDIRVASVENELKAAQICGAVEVFVASVKPGDVVPKVEWPREDAEPARVLAGPVNAFESHTDDFGITSTGAMAEDFGKVGLAAGEHLTDK